MEGIIRMINTSIKSNKIKIENSLLQQQQSGLVSEKAELVKKNEFAKEEIEAILERIKNVESD